MSGPKKNNPEIIKKEVQRCWDIYPMSYNIDCPQGTKEYFQSIDQQFEYLHFFGHKNRPLLSGLIDYPSLKRAAVLEVGCGLGSLAEELAKSAGSTHALDLTPTAARMTGRRFSEGKYNALALQGDAENLPFPDEKFDYILSWGVLHHTPRTQQAIDEIYRVLKPGGRIGIMLYHRNSLNFYYHMVFKWGVIGGKLLSHNIQGILNLRTDREGGTPLAKAYRVNEIRQMFSKYESLKFEIYGQKTEIDTSPIRYFPLAKWIIPSSIRYDILRKWGWYIWITGNKTQK
jgi:ubiquinone/menaquinone biosynthesis C-methylase UbiE